jgi:hypothetical protein
MAIRWLTMFLDFPGGAFEPGVAFWREVTGYGLSQPRGADGEFATLLPKDGDAYLRVQRVADGDGGCHLDLHVDTGTESLQAVADRAVRLGATPRHHDGDGGLIICDSPGGFTFCLVRWDGAATVPGSRVTGGGATRADTLCLDIPPDGFERECAFWSALTGWDARPARVPGFSYLLRPAGPPAGPPAEPPAELPIRLLLQQLKTTGPGQRARAHVDFGCTDAGEVSKHAALGARVTGKFPFWTVLTDPAGREYCLVERDPRGS